MKTLSQVLPSIEMHGSQSEPNRITSLALSDGLTESAGMTSLSAQIRPRPLQENELTRIASRLLPGPQSIGFCRQTIYGPKTFRDEFGECVLPDQKIGEELVICVGVAEDCDQDWLSAALRLSPPAAYVAHLTRLAMHKILGSGDQDRSILLNDYAQALSEYPEFVVWVVCRHFWENDENRFFPKIAQLKQSCEAVMNEISKIRPKALPTPEQIAADNARRQRVQREAEDRIAWQQIALAKRTAWIAFLCEKNGTKPEDYSFTSDYQIEMAAKSHGFGRPPEPHPEDSKSEAA